MVQWTYNSTNPGLPFPIKVSKLSGIRSSTFDAPTVASKVTNNENENNMGGGKCWRRDVDCAWSSRYVSMYDQRPSDITTATIFCVFCTSFV